MIANLEILAHTGHGLESGFRGKCKTEHGTFYKKIFLLASKSRRIENLKIFCQYFNSRNLASVSSVVSMGTIRPTQLKLFRITLAGGPRYAQAEQNGKISES